MQTQLTSVSRYRRLCEEFLTRAFERPEMYFRTLRELEAVMEGHSLACVQLGLIPSRADSFNVALTAWLDQAGVNTPSGWGYALEKLHGTGYSSEVGERLDEFVRAWLDKAKAQSPKQPKQRTKGPQ